MDPVCMPHLRTARRGSISTRCRRQSRSRPRQHGANPRWPRVVGPAFIQYAVTANVDYQIGVVTTDVGQNGVLRTAASSRSSFSTRTTMLQPLAPGLSTAPRVATLRTQRVDGPAPPPLTLRDAELRRLGEGAPQRVEGRGAEQREIVRGAM